MIESQLGSRYRLIVDLLSLEHGQALYDELKERVEKLKRRAFQQGALSDDFRQDIRWILGKIAAYDEILGLPEEKRRELEGKKSVH